MFKYNCLLSFCFYNVQQQNQIRPTASIAPTIPVASTQTTQVRVMTPIPTPTTTVPRPTQSVQQRLVSVRLMYPATRIS